MSDNRMVTSSSSGIGFCGLLTILFIALKLTGFIDWSWFWVLSPMIFSVGLVALVVIVFIVLLIWANSR